MDLLLEFLPPRMNFVLADITLDLPSPINLIQEVMCLKLENGISHFLQKLETGARIGVLSYKIQGIK